MPEDVFRAYVAARTGGGERGVSEAVASSLYLACACVRKDPAAIKAFDAAYMPGVERAIARMRLPPADVKDVAQSLREHLLVGKAGEAPQIAEYGGRGDLAGWLRVAAVRAALKSLRGRKPHAELDDARLALRSMGDDPELSYMKEVYRKAFREAFAAALASLEPREKNLLRQHFVDGLGVDELGRLYGAHRATAARWLQRARENLLDATKTNFARRAGLSARESASVLRMVRSRIDVTFGRLLA